jgi:hypothetical protein
MEANLNFLKRDESPDITRRRFISKYQCTRKIANQVSLHWPEWAYIWVLKAINATVRSPWAGIRHLIFFLLCQGNVALVEPSGNDRIKIWLESWCCWVPIAISASIQLERTGYVSTYVKTCCFARSSCLPGGSCTKIADSIIPTQMQQSAIYCFDY